MTVAEAISFPDLTLVSCQPALLFTVIYLRIRTATMLLHTFGIASPTRPVHTSPFRSPIALPSYHPNPTHDSSAPRRGLADGATEQAPGSAVGSLALAGTSPSPSRHRCRAPQTPSTGPRLGVPAGSRVVVGSRMSVRMPAVGRSPCPRTRSRPRVRCPSSVRACDVHASAVQCPGVGVRCPASVSARAASARAASASAVCIGDLVERVGAAGSHTARRGPGLAVLPHPRTARTSA
jgi:hypothetical protein